MTLLDIQAIENAGRTATVWIPEPADRQTRWAGFAVAASALGIVSVAGLLLAALF